MKYLILFVFFASSMLCYSQIDKEQLALNVSKADAKNLDMLKEYIWKRKSTVFIDNVLKLTTLSEFSFSADGKLETKQIDAETTVKEKPGLRGSAQKSASSDKADYVQKALELSLAYTFMSKGEMVDFFDKATLTEKDGFIEAVASNVHVKGDKLFMRIEKETNLIVYKEFSSLLGTDAMDGKLNYEKFKNGTLHGTNTVLNLPAQKMRIDGLNQDYTIRVQ